MRNGALLRKDPRTGSYRSYLPDSSGSILRILPVRDGKVWVGTTKGLHCLTPETGEVVWLGHDPQDPASLGPGFVTALLEDRQGRLWAGTGEGGLQELDRNGRVLRRFLPDPGLQARHS